MILSFKVRLHTYAPSLEGLFSFVVNHESLLLLLYRKELFVTQVMHAHLTSQAEDFSARCSTCHPIRWNNFTVYNDIKEIMVYVSCVYIQNNN